MMFKRILTLTLLSIGSSAYANDSRVLSFLDQLDSLAKVNETETLQKSIQSYYKDEPEVKRGKYPSLLHDAAIMSNLFLLRYLVDASIRQVDYAYQDGPTALGYIAGDNQTKSAKLLLELGANPNNVGNTQGSYPLASAVVSGNMEMIKMLLDYGAEVHAGAYFQSPLGLTIERNDIEILQVLDQYDFKLDSMDDELRIIVIEYLNSELVEEEVLKVVKSHGFDIYQKTEEKASFFEEYKGQIKFSDVKQMLLDIYQPELPISEPSEDETPLDVTSFDTDDNSPLKANNTDNKDESVEDEKIDQNQASGNQASTEGKAVAPETLNNDDVSKLEVETSTENTVSTNTEVSSNKEDNLFATPVEADNQVEKALSANTIDDKIDTESENNTTSTVENTDAVNNKDDKITDNVQSLESADTEKQNELTPRQ